MAYYVYVLTNALSTSLYIGVTNDLERRVYQHKRKLVPGFTSRYNLNRLVYFEESEDAQSAIAREKQLKGWLRRRKVELVNSMNPDWLDLAADWFS